MNNKGADQTGRMCTLVYACVVRKPLKTGFLASRPIFTKYIVYTCNLYSQKNYKKNISRHVLILSFGNAVVNDNCQNCYQVSINNLSKSLSLRFLKIYRIKTDLCITSGKQTKQGIINGQKNSKSDCTNLLSVWSGISPSARNIIQLFTGNPKWKH